MCFVVAEWILKSGIEAPTAVCSGGCLNVKEQ